MNRDAADRTAVVVRPPGVSALQTVPRELKWESRFDPRRDQVSLSASPALNQHPAQPLITDLCKAIAEHSKAYVGSPGDYALLNFPNHANVGDSAIWLGELAHLKATFGSRPAFVCEEGNFNADDLRRAVPNGPIFFEGGGDFGDLYPHCQVFRELIIEQFPDRHIIQLPQSLNFTNPDLIEKTARVVHRHKKFVLFVRDKHSLEIAQSSFDCPVHLAPDMAFCLGPIRRPVTAKHKLLLLLRTDGESARVGEALPGHLPEGVVITDWLRDEPALNRRMIFLTAMNGLLSLQASALCKPALRRALFRNLAQNRLDRGVKLLSSAEFVITDRLHGHILCLLLGIPHIALDNSYGKLSGFISTWTKDCPFVRVAPSLDEAIRLWDAVQ